MNQPAVSTGEDEVCVGAEGHKRDKDRQRGERKRSKQSMMVSKVETEVGEKELEPHSGEARMGKEADKGPYKTQQEASSGLE